ncbi:hypothetical protein [Nostoc sp. MS1]|uniref:hypothetical protein n=1 Tax=Nostoc sp. MS1 TaxID=2764711 RepID=UPI001CC3934A|nr:hypothetical protein [Nostoc sp. MS1]BCL39676.1 hypothetical protein NSMS1_61230 [Nostoc sp. MS1]
MPYTSWNKKHTKHDFYPCRNLNILLDGVEKAIKHRVRYNSDWWLQNEIRLRTSSEVAIRYFIIEAYKENICYSSSIKFWFLMLDIEFVGSILLLNQFLNFYILGIERLLEDQDIFCHEKLIYALGELMQMAYPKISESAQLNNQTLIASLISKIEKNEKGSIPWAYRNLYDICLSIPSIFRTREIQIFLDNWANYFGSNHPRLNVYSWGGLVIPPLSTQDLLKLSIKGLFQLLHYYGKHRVQDIASRDMIGGFSEIKSILREACSLNPVKFINLFSLMVQANLHQEYISTVVEGIAYHLEYRFGNVKPGQKWEPSFPLPDGEKLASTLLNWLERYSILWNDGSIVSTALKACCHVLVDSESAKRLSLLLFWLYTKYPYDRQIRKHSNDIISAAISSTHGIAASSAITLCNRLLEEEQPVPELLLLLLPHIASDSAIYVRIPVLQQIHYLIYKKPNLGWLLLENIFKEPQLKLWKYSGTFLYLNYRDNFNQIALYLNRLLHEGMEEAGDIWGRISTLASLAGHIDQQQLFEILIKTNNNPAWEGATQVFIANLHLQEHTKKCISGLILILQNRSLSGETITLIDRCFQEETRNYITREFAFTFISSLKSPVRNIDFDSFLEWLGYESRRNPIEILELIEELAKKFETEISVYSIYPTQPLIIALNEILREADDTDELQLIQRAINLQDRFLKLNIEGMEELLRKAERE